MKIIVLVLTLLSLNVMADNFCSRTNAEIKALLYQESSHLDFKNNGGLFSGGVCWWHSRMQRSSAYLAKYRPELPKPTKAQIASILRNLRKMKRVVEIPGYENFQDFSQENREQIQKSIETWQSIDSFIKQQWFRGLLGQSHLSAKHLEKRMNKIFKDYQLSPNPIWVKAQIKGIAAHAFLIVDIIKVKNGYNLRVIDSNRPTTSRLIAYAIGSKTLRILGGSYDFVLYTGFQNDFKKINRAIQRYCPNN